MSSVELSYLSTRHPFAEPIVESSGSESWSDENTRFNNVAPVTVEATFLPSEAAHFEDPSEYAEAIVTAVPIDFVGPCDWRGRPYSAARRNLNQVSVFQYFCPQRKPG